MRNLMVTMFVSLDGVMQGAGETDEDRESGFEHGGWAVPFFDDRLIGQMADLVGRADALLLGRKTYDVFAASWPLAADDDPIGSKLNAMRKYVASRTLEAPAWHNSTVLSGDLPDAVRKLKEEDGGEIQVHGSGELIQTLLEHDLVDEFHVLVFPVLLGSGKRLFGPGTAPASLKLVDSSTSATGVVVCTYVRDGDLAYGTMGPETGNW